MLFNACQIGITIPLSDLSLHTYWELNDYAARQLKQDKKEGLPKQSISDFVKTSGKNYG